MGSGWQDHGIKLRSSASRRIKVHLALFVMATVLAAQHSSTTTGPIIPAADCSTEPGSCAMFNEMLAAKDSDFSGFQSKDFTAYVCFEKQEFFGVIIQQSCRAPGPECGRETACPVSAVPIVCGRSRARTQVPTFHLVSEPK